MFAHHNQGHLKIFRSKSRNRRGKEPGILSKDMAWKIKKMLGAA